MTRLRIAHVVSFVLAVCAWCVASSAHATNVLGYPDFNGDGKSDLVWIASGSALSAIWLMDGTDYLAEGLVFYSYGYGFRRADADFDGNGKSDLIWRQFDTPQGSAIAIMDGVTPKQVVPTGFIAATPDLDGDGSSDLALIESATNPQTLRLELMDGIAPKATRLYTLPADWFVPYTIPTRPLDFDGDGKSDLLFEKPSFGNPTYSAAIWVMDGLAVKSAAEFRVDRIWEVVNFADFDGDGKTDLLWWNGSTGEFAIWLMDGITVRDATVLPYAGPWIVTLVGDFDGDGRVDILWHKLGGTEVAMWLMDGLAVKSAVSWDVGPGWQAVTLADFNGDGKADIVWTKHTDVAFWLMDGTAVLKATSFPIDRNWSIVPTTSP